MRVKTQKRGGRGGVEPRSSSLIYACKISQGWAVGNDVVAFVHPWLKLKRRYCCYPSLESTIRLQKAMGFALVRVEELDSDTWKMRK